MVDFEIFVAATIIKTITFEQTTEGRGLLTLMIAVRALPGWTTVLEMTGRWPLQRPPAQEAKNT